MNYKAILLAGAISAWICSEMIPVAQIWVPVTIVAMIAVFVAQKVTA